jgi:branched-chain amino acid aminotransferase
LAYSNINGKIMPANEAAVPADNGAFRYGYGLFETMLVSGGVIQLGEHHWKRLFDSAQQMYFRLPTLMTPTWLEDQVLRTVARNGLSTQCRVRLQLYAGDGGLYGNGNEHPGFIIECYPLEEGALTLNENGLLTGIASGINKSPDTLANMKTCNALIYALAARQAKANKWNDALVLNTNSHIIESSIANIFWIKDNVVYTPPLSDGCVAGVMRQHVIRTIEVTVQHLTVHELLGADEVFLTNAIKKVRWIGRIADTTFRNVMIRDIYATL